VRRKGVPEDQLARENKKRVQQGLTEAIRGIAEQLGDEDLQKEILANQPRSNVLPPPAPADSGTHTNPFGIVDIITFSEHPYYLGLPPLFPYQKMMLKSLYAGTAGNTQLVIEHDKPTDPASCQGCVWQFVRKSEDEQVAIIDGGLKPKTPALKEGSSPCLTCSRFPADKMGRRYDHLKANALGQAAKDKIDRLRARDVKDGHQTELDLLDSDEISRPMADQVKRKWKAQNTYSDLVLVLGRRAGKSMMVSIIALYEVYRLIMMPNPQRHYGMIDGDIITVLNVALSLEQALTAIFSKVKAYALGSPFMSSKIGHALVGELYFVTPADDTERKRREQQGIKVPMHGTIKLVCGHSNSKSLLGGNIITCIIDEMAAMVGKNEETSTDYQLYTQIKPAGATFLPDSKMLCISNPGEPQGQLYKLYRASFTDDTKLMWQLPTWLSNVAVSYESLTPDRNQDPAAFPMQYAAEFGRGAKDALLTEEVVEAAFLAGSGDRRREFGDPRNNYYAHLDPAHSSDYYTLVIAHAEPIHGEFDLVGKPVMRMVIDHIHLWKPKKGEKHVLIQEVDAYVFHISKRFNIKQFSYDHWNSIGSIQKLQRAGLNAVQRTFNPNYQDLIFNQMTDLFLTGRIQFYDIDTLVDGDTVGEKVSLDDVILARDQFIWLQQVYSNGRRKVQAARNHHDDIPDCVAAVCYEALGQLSFNQSPRTVRMRTNRIF
jgi:hypothetical protein